MRSRHAAAALLVLLAAAGPAAAGGISIDAGLTPPDGRWIFRTQVRAMERTAPDGGDASMERLVVPLVAVHGVTPELTVGARQAWEARTMAMGGGETTRRGLGDTYVFAKYRALRINTRAHTLGVAPLVGVEAPTGADGISSGSWDLNAGLFVSGRAGAWALDLSAVYGVRGFAGVDDGAPEPGDEIAVDAAFARQFALDPAGRTALAPVLEVNVRDVQPDAGPGGDLPDSGETVLSVAPGAKYTRGDLIVEGLVRLPVAQTQEGRQLEAGPMVLLGVRRMF